jgi:hypothetical protein
MRPGTANAGKAITIRFACGVTVPSPQEGTFPRRLGTTASRSPAIHSNPRTPGNSDDESLPRQPPPVAFSPIKARQRRKDNDIKSLSDAAARAYTDEEIIGEIGLDMPASSP